METWNNISMHPTSLHGQTYQQHLTTVYLLSWAKPWMENQFGEQARGLDALQWRRGSIAFAGRGHHRAACWKRPKMAYSSWCLKDSVLSHGVKIRFRRLRLILGSGLEAIPVPTTISDSTQLADLVLQWSFICGISKSILFQYVQSKYSSWSPPPWSPQRTLLVRPSRDRTDERFRRITPDRSPAHHSFPKKLYQHGQTTF